MKKTLILLLASLSVSLITPAFGLGVRVGTDISKHQCKYIGGGDAKKVEGCKSASVNSVAVYFETNFPLKLYLRTELGSVGEQKFTGSWEPSAIGKQEITVNKHLRAIASVHREFGFLLTKITPMIGVGYASLDASGSRGDDTSFYKAKTNRNELEVYGLSFGIRTLPFFALDYRFINYGDIETGVAGPADNEALRGDLTSQHIGISFSF